MKADTNADDGSTPEGVWRKRAYVVEIETPEGIKEGRSIVAWRSECVRTFPEGKSCGPTAKMEGSAIDLPNGDTVYVTLTTNEGAGYDHPMGYQRVWKDEDVGKLKREYKEEYLPDLIMFEDESDPSTVVWIDPTKPFGDGYTVKRAYVDGTIDQSLEPTQNLRKRLPWLATDNHGTFAGKPYIIRSGTTADQFSIGSLELGHRE